MTEPQIHPFIERYEQVLLRLTDVPYNLIVTTIENVPAGAPLDAMRSLASQVMAEYKKEITPTYIDLADIIEGLPPAEQARFTEQYEQILENAAGNSPTGLESGTEG